LVLPKNELRPQAADPNALAMSDGPMSRHEQIRRYILAQITSGRWSEDYRIPSESELVASLGVSRMTVHHALKDLRDKGFLRRVQGLGTFVAKPRDYVTIIKQSDIVEDVRLRGGFHSARVVRREIRAASVSEAAMFKMREDGKVFHVHVLHHENGEPIQLEDRTINVDAAPGCEEHDIERETLFAYLMRLRPYREGKETITARAATSEEAKLLKLSKGEPCLEIARLTWSADEVVTSARLIYPGNRHRIVGRIYSNEGNL
jgi:GntR family transcriptional regulator, histidine utilization repressor